MNFQDTPLNLMVCVKNCIYSCSEKKKKKKRGLGDTTQFYSCGHATEVTQHKETKDDPWTVDHSVQVSHNSFTAIAMPIAVNSNSTTADKTIEYSCSYIAT